MSLVGTQTGATFLLNSLLKEMPYKEGFVFVQITGVGTR
ncbi:MAG: hypothetical protein IPG53_19920 [Ignavibacteriales bacterium]|nr:hypothetical protein [Ignavibacteriales bacterium]